MASFAAVARWPHTQPVVETFSYTFTRTTEVRDVASVFGPLLEGGQRFRSSHTGTVVMMSGHKIYLEGALVSFA